MASTRREATGAGASLPSGPSELTAVDALEFFDPHLSRLPRAVDLVRVLLDVRYETDPIELDAQEERTLLERVAYHRLHRQLGAAIDAGRLVASDKLMESIEKSALMLATRRLSLEGLAVEASGTLTSVGVESLVLKGIAVGRLDYMEPTHRHTTDVDIMVRRDDFKRATGALSAAGFTRRNALNLLDKGQSWERPSGVVDLHTRPHAAGNFLGEPWWVRSESFPIAGHELRALSRAGRLAHAASHFSLSYPNHRTFSSLLDVLTISRAATAADRIAAEQFLSEVGVSDITSRITGRAAVLIGDRAVMLGRRGRRPLDIVLRRAYDRSDLDLVSIKLAKTFGMPWREKPRAIRTLLVPDDDFLREGGYSSRVDRLKTLAGRRWRRFKGR